MTFPRLRTIAYATLASFPLFSTPISTAQAGKADDTLVWVREQEVAVADPYYANNASTVILGDEVCDNLLVRDPVTRDYVPNLATSYRWVDDTTIEFALRQGVTFHGGSKFSAADVKYTFDHVSAPDSGVIQRPIVDWILSTEIVDEYKVRIKAKQPTPIALEYLSGMLYIMPQGHYDKAPVRQGRKDYGSVPLNCTGPYKITKLNPGTTIDMAANTAYFAGPKPKPKISKLQYRTMVDRDAQIIELLGGNVHWVWDVQRDKARELRDMGQVQIKESPILRFSYIGFDSAGKGGPNPFQDVRVRRAVAHAINAGPIAKNFVGDTAELISTACHPLQFGCRTGLPRYAYDPRKARDLLAEAGFPNGISTSIFSFSHRDVLEAIQNDLRAVGIRANLRSMQYNALRPLLRSGEAKLTFLTWGSNRFNDATASTSYFFTGTEDDTSLDPEVKASLQVADASVDPAIRKAAFAKAQEIIAEKVYWVPLFTMALNYGGALDLEFTPYFDDLPRFYRASWK